MKLLYTTPFIYKAGGTERILSTKVNYLVRKAGYDVVIVTTDQIINQSFFEFDKRIKHYDLGLNYEDDFHHNIISKTLSHLWKNQKYQKKLAEIIRIEKPDVCISLFGREIEFIGNMSLPCKIIAELHFNRYFRYNIITSTHKGWLWKLLGRFRTWQLINETKRLNKIVVLTKEDRDEWLKTNKNICQIYNSLPFDSQEVSELVAKSIITVGRLSPEKNYSSLIRAWVLVNKKHPDWSLNIWGEGELKNELQEEIDSYSLQNAIHLCGRTNNVVQEYLKSSAYVMSSSFEGFPMVLLEAATCGLPLISYDCYCGPKDIIENGRNGLLVHKGDEQALAEAICKVIENESLRHKMGQEAKKTSRQFSPDIILPQWPKFFEELVKE